jgi:predicted TIM-barrel enzyme
MPYGDANGVVEMAREVLPIVKQTPVLAGVCGTDPFRQMDVFFWTKWCGSALAACKIFRPSA